LVSSRPRAGVLSIRHPEFIDAEGTMQKADWVIDILRDIRQFSEKNGMPELAEHLDDAIFVAACEIGAKLDGVGTELGKGRARSRTGAVAEHEVH
jgi:hypothetical protein